MMKILRRLLCKLGIHFRNIEAFTYTPRTCRHCGGIEDLGINHE